MSKYEELNERLDRTRIYIVGSNEWTEMMIAMYHAVHACLSIETENAETIIGLMEKECEAMDEQLDYDDYYGEQIKARKAEYEYGAHFSDHDNQLEGRY